METIKVINYVIMVIFFACYAYQFLYIPIAWLKKQKPLPKGLLHRYAVLIAARNEETVIGSLIESIKRQNYPADRIDIYVIADNCTDCTAKAAKSHGATVFERFDKVRIGKGYALNYLLGRIKKIYDAYLVISPRMNTVRQRFKRLCPMEESTVSTSAPFANLNMVEAIFIITLTHARIAAGAMFMSISKHENFRGSSLLSVSHRSGEAPANIPDPNASSVGRTGEIL